MDIVAETRGDLLVVMLRERRLDAAVVIRFKEEMRGLVDCPARRVILDLSQVEFLDSSGLGALVAVMKHLAPARRLELAGLTVGVMKVFRLTRMDTVFTIHASARPDDVCRAG